MASKPPAKTAAKGLQRAVFKVFFKKPQNLDGRVGGPAAKSPHRYFRRAKSRN